MEENSVNQIVENCFEEKKKKIVSTFENDSFFFLFLFYVNMINVMKIPLDIFLKYTYKLNVYSFYVYPQCYNNLNLERERQMVIGHV